MRRSLHQIISILGLLYLAACTSAAHQPAADPALASAIRSGGIHDGMAHVFVYLGVVNGLVFDVSSLSPADVVVNGFNVGGINKNECMYLAISPGLYNFSWVERASSGAIRSAQFSYTFGRDSDAYLALNIDEHTGAMFGLIGAIADPPTGSIEKRADGREKIANMKIVLPDNDVVAQIRPMGAEGQGILNPAPTQPFVKPIPGNSESLTDIEQLLEGLKVLYDKGVITKDEYNAKRKELLGKIH